MSFVVARMIKLKSHDIKGIQFHNQRERESKTNSDIDKSKTHLNYDLVNPTNIDYNKQVKEIIDSQKISDRKTRKDAVLVNEFLVTSDKPFFEKLSPDREKDFFKESAEFFKKRYGEQNIAFATVHIDEKTPHMHIGVVPMRDGRLQGKNVFNRQELLWIQDELPKHLQKLGFDIERGEKGSKREHIEIQKFKADTLDEKVKALETKLDDVQKAYEVVQKVDEVPVKEKKDIRARIGLNSSHKVEVAFEDFERIKTLAKSSEGLKMQNKSLIEKNKHLIDQNNKLSNENKSLKNENHILQKENTTLKQENKFLSRTLNQLKVLLKDKVKDLDKLVGYVKAHLLDRMGMKMHEKHFNDKDEVAGAQFFLKEREKENKNELEL